MRDRATVSKFEIPKDKLAKIKEVLGCKTKVRSEKNKHNNKRVKNEPSGEGLQNKYNVKLVDSTG